MDKDRFDAIKEAFEALRTPERRADYDRSLHGSHKAVSAVEDAKRTGTARLVRRMQEMDKTQAFVAVACPVCGHRNAAGESYCSECGFLLTSRPDSGASLAQSGDVAQNPHLISETGKVYPLRAGVNTVGRESGDIVLPDKTVSRHHAQLVYDEDRGIYSVEDTESTNGTHVNNQRLLPKIPHPILPGDDIQFGSVPLKLVAYEKTAILTEPTDELDSQQSAIVGVLRLARGSGLEEITLVLGNNTIGRMPDNSICIRNDRYISGHHSRIEADPRFFRLVDLGSTNGTFLNGLRLTTNEAIAISEGDEITLGGTVYTFHRSEAAPPAQSASKAGAPEPTPPLIVGGIDEPEIDNVDAGGEIPVEEAASEASA